MYAWRCVSLFVYACECECVLAGLRAMQQSYRVQIIIGY